MINTTCPIESIEPQRLGLLGMEHGTDLGLFRRTLREKTHDQPNLLHRSQVLEFKMGLHLTFNSAQRMQACRLGGCLRFIGGTRAGDSTLGAWTVMLETSQTMHVVERYTGTSYCIALLLKE